MAKILVAMSGGVDSSFVAYLLSKNHQIKACYMKLFDDEEKHIQNLKNIQQVCNALGIEYEVLDLSKKFEEFVYNPFVRTYAKGQTPNPCVLCNRYIKTGTLVEYAKKLGFDKLATGHYAKIENGFITEGYDKSKDQSYFLANVDKKNLDFLIFPLGNMLKTDIKAKALEIDFLKSLSTQKESSEICFVKDTYLEVLNKHMQTQIAGDVINKDGEIIGKHKGYMHYTIGKRKGFEVKGAHEPHFVTKINPITNQITVGKKDELEVHRFELKDLNMFINELEFDCDVKIRYRSQKTPCHVSISNNKAKVSLKQSTYALAIGQMAVFYQGEKVIGGGWIEG